MRCVQGEIKRGKSLGEHLGKLQQLNDLLIGSGSGQQSSRYHIFSSGTKFPDSVQAEIPVSLRPRGSRRGSDFDIVATCAIFVRKQSMKSRGELGSREAWCSRTLRAMSSFMPLKFRNMRLWGPGNQSRRLGKMLYIWGKEQSWQGFGKQGTQQGM